MVLLYHGIVPDTKEYDPVELGVIFQAEFERQLDWLKKNCVVLHADEFINLLFQGSTFPRNAVLITIDDGLQNTLDFALPVAEASDVPILAFVATGHMDDGEWLWYSRLKAYQLAHPGSAAPDQHALEQLTISEIEVILNQADMPRRANGSEFEHLIFDGMRGAQLAQAARSKYLTVGGHTVRHPRLVNESPEIRRREILDNKRTLEEITGQSVNLFAYPQGVYDDRVIQDVGQAGYLAAFAANESVRKLPAEMDRYNIPRTGVYRPGKFWFWYVSHPAGRWVKSFKRSLFG
jgi:peptidoglycan/xylan/chitin deacetylase (PgdA/CDA1 family)